MNRKIGLIIAVSLVFLALLVTTPTAAALDINHDSGNVSLSGKQYWGYHIALPDGGGLKYTIKANNSVNIYLLDKANLQNYVNGQSFKYIKDGSVLDTNSASVQLFINKSASGDYYIVVESANYKPVSFSYDITYGKDVEVSFLDFISGLNSMMCIAGGLIFIIWLLVLVWVYRDARRRGKSGLLWVLIVFFLSIIGLIIWLIVRPKQKIK